MASQVNKVKEPPRLLTSTLHSVANYVVTKWTHEWNIYTYQPEDENPFCYLPPRLIHHLIDLVIKLTPESLDLNFLFLLLASRQVEEFKFLNVHMKYDSLIKMLHILGSYNKKLQLLDMNLQLSLQEVGTEYEQQILLNPCLEALFKKCPHIKHIRSDVTFDLSLLQHCPNIQVLFLPKLSLWKGTHNCDVSWRSYDQCNFFYPQNQATQCVLQQCPSLISTNLDISKCLEKIHGDEYTVGTLSKTYPLKKFHLGGCDLSDAFCLTGAASLLSIHIATLTCPHLTELKCAIDSKESIEALRYFKELTSLKISWRARAIDYFQGGMTFLLGELGSKLKVLTLTNFINTDLVVIVLCCPHLEHFEMKGISESDSLRVGNVLKYGRPTIGLSQLKILKLEVFQPLDENSLLLLLSHSLNIEVLRIGFAKTITDSFLQKLLQVNPLSKLRELAMLHSRVTREGLVTMVAKLPSLCALTFNSYEINEEEIAETHDSINRPDLYLQLS